MSLIKTKNLSCHFGGIKAVDNVDFTLDKGEIRAIIGPNGAGKSTFVSMLCGRQPPTQGRIFFHEQDITDVAPHDRAVMGIAYTFQITSVFNNLSCYENVELAAQRHLLNRSDKRWSQADLHTATLDALTLVGLDSRAKIQASNLSYGHQRLLEVAMGLALKPVVLMLDEPTQGLADSEIENFITLVQQVAQSATILLIEHNMDVVMQLAEQITVFDAGEILAQGSPAEIQSNRAVQLAYLGT